MSNILKLIKPVLGRIIILLIFLALIVVSLCTVNRISLFAKLFNNFFFNLSTFSLILYFISIVIVIIYNAAFIFVYFYKPEESKEKLFSFDNKFDIIHYIFKCVALIFAFLMYIISPCTVSGNSMCDTLQSGDKLLTFNICFTVNVDDIVVFNAEANHSEEEFYIKRVVATENDKISIDNNFIIYVNDIMVGNLGNNSYEEFARQINLNEKTKSTIVPKNKIFVMGDNRDHSCDSRTFGYVDKTSIYGKVFLRIYPSFGSVKKDILD